MVKVTGSKDKLNSSLSVATCSVALVFFSVKQIMTVEKLENVLGNNSKKKNNVILPPTSRGTSSSVSKKNNSNN